MERNTGLDLLKSIFLLFFLLNYNIISVVNSFQVVMLKNAFKNIFRGDKSTNLDQDSINSILNDDEIIISPDTKRR
jgi:hypothetical protein